MQQLFVSFEGSDGAGKTTLRRWLYALLDARGITCTVVPQQSWLHPHSSRVIIDTRLQCKQHAQDAVLRAYAYDKYLLGEHFIKPARTVGHIFSDRSILSDAVYHEVLYQIPARKTLETHLHLGTVFPDVIVFVDVESEEACQRIHKREVDLSPHERPEILSQVINLYKQLLLDSPPSYLPTVIHFPNQDDNWQERALKQIVPLFFPNPRS